MRVYEVLPGDSPASIAGRDDMAGCPKCAIDLVRANPHKEVVVYPNGFRTFRDLQVGEKLNLPDKWFDGTLDKLPKSYFEGLAHPSGLSGAFGVGAYEVEFGPEQNVFPTVLVSAAQSAYAALDADPDYCSSVARVGSSVNSAVHLFKMAWNASQSPPVPINTGNYEQQTKDALLKVLGYAAPACPSRYYSPPPSVAPAPAPTPVAIVEENRLSTAAIAGIALLGAGAIGGVAYFATKKPRRRSRRSRRRQ